MSADGHSGILPVYAVMLALALAAPLGIAARRGSTKIEYEENGIREHF